MMPPDQMPMEDDPTAQERDVPPEMEAELKDRLFDELMEFAEMRMAEDLKKKYRADPEAVEEAPVEEPPQAEDDVSPEDLEKLAATLGE
jgi:hypothetical protein